MGRKAERNTGMPVKKLEEIIIPFCEGEGFEFVHLEHVMQNKENIIRIFLDKPSGITLNDCVYASRQLGDLIDVHLENIGTYRLEVSSPGPNRPLNKKKDFQRFKGERVKIEVNQPIDNRRKFTGTLETINDDSVVIAVDGKQVEISDQAISKAILAGQ
jgi:ribosome maturation factor RimP